MDSEWIPVESNTRNDLKSIWGLPEDAILAVGNQGTVVRWDGALPTATPNWTAVPTPTFSPTATPPATTTPTATPTLAATATWPPEPTNEPSVTPEATGAPETPVPTPTPALEFTPTVSPSATGSPNPTPPALELGARIELATDMAQPGSVFWVRGYLDNPDATTLRRTPVFFVLDVWGALYFWPRWLHYNPPGQPAVDFSYVDIRPGTVEIEVIAPFTWPDTGADQISGLYFYGALLNNQLSAVLGNLAVAEWGYGP